MYYISINPFANRIPERWPARRKRAQHNSKLKEWESKVPSRCSTQIIQQHPVHMHSTFWKCFMKFWNTIKNNILNVSKVKTSLFLAQPDQMGNSTGAASSVSPDMFLMERWEGKLPESLWEVEIFGRHSNNYVGWLHQGEGCGCWFCLLFSTCRGVSEASTVWLWQCLFGWIIKDVTR